jgi:DNA-binding transcriptional LysR family regulator
MSAFLNDRWMVFVKAAEFGSFSRAANFFNLPQSNVSRQIAQLEEELGARLFHRNGRGVTLSEVGQRLLPRLVDLVEQADRLNDQILTQGQTPIGEVRVGLLPWCVPVLAAPLFRAVREQLPQVQLHFCEAPGAQLDEFLEHGRIDLATSLQEHDGTVLERGKELACVSLKLIGPTGAPFMDAPTVRFRHLDGVPLIVPSAGHPLRANLARLAKKHGISLNIAVEADSIRLQHEVCIGGGGYALTSGFNRGTAMSNLSSSTIVEPKVQRSIGLTATLRRPDTLAVRAVERTIRNMAPDLFKEKRA